MDTFILVCLVTLILRDLIMFVATEPHKWNGILFKISFLASALIAVGALLYKLGFVVRM